MSLHAISARVVGERARHDSPPSGHGSARTLGSGIASPGMQAHTAESLPDRKGSMRSSMRRAIGGVQCEFNQQPQHKLRRSQSFASQLLLLSLLLYTVSAAEQLAMVVQTFEEQQGQQSSRRGMHSAVADASPSPADTATTEAFEESAAQAAARRTLRNNDHIPLPPTPPDIVVYNCWGTALSPPPLAPSLWFST